MTNTQLEIVPGDVISVKIPGLSPGQSPSILVRVLDKPATKKDCLVGIVCDLFFFLGASETNIRPGQETEIGLSDIVRVYQEKVDSIQPQLKVEIRDGCIHAMARTDGKTEPLLVKVVDLDEGGEPVLYAVDAVRTTVKEIRKLTLPDQHEPMLPFMQENLPPAA